MYRSQGVIELGPYSTFPLVMRHVFLLYTFFAVKGDIVISFFLQVIRIRPDSLRPTLVPYRFPVFIMYTTGVDVDGVRPTHVFACIATRFLDGRIFHNNYDVRCYAFQRERGTDGDCCSLRNTRYEGR